MYHKEINKYIRELQRYMSKISTSKEAAIKFLQKTGIYTKSGNLKKEYR
jgi:hypothetical protein